MSDKIDMIYDLLKQDREEASDFRREVRESYQDTSEKLAQIEVETSTRLAKIESTSELQNKQLEEHVRRTDILEKLHRDNEVRITKLEEPVKVISSIKKWVIIAGKVAGAVVAIGGAIAFILGLF